MYLFDTDILIDYLRLYQPALDFFDHLPAKNRSIAFISQCELLQGCRRKEDEKLISRFFKKFRVLPLTLAASKTALQIYRIHRFKNAMGIPDSFIAATAIVNKLILLSRNEKHYQKVGALKIKKPYG